MRRGLVAGAMAVVLIGGCARLRLGNGGDIDLELQERVRAELGTPRPDFVTPDADGRRLWKKTRAFYDARQYAPAWIDGRTPRPQMESLIGAIRAVDAEGLDPELYSASTLDARHAKATKGFLSKEGFPAAEAGEYDVWLTYLYLRLASDLADGISDLAKADRAWKIAPEEFDPVSHLETALREDRVAESLAALTPVSPQYRALRDGLAEHRAQAAKGGWPRVPGSLTLRPGQSNAAIPALARRLAASGDYVGSVPADRASAYTRALQDAVKRFQRRHGLQDDAVVGPAVVAQLNVPIETRIRQIQLNMERWRWLPRDLGARYILVNIPAYRLDVWERDRVRLTMRVVVGKKDSQTPIFEERMTHVVFSPYWNVPPDIARDETLPSMLQDAAFLERNNMEIVDDKGNAVDAGDVDPGDMALYRFRQRPGAGNSLGLVKFMFPNQFNVYLHDTPADSLFERAGRSLSHGCVRVEQPAELAAYVLRDQPEWTPDRIDEAMHGEAEQTVKLKQPLPVYLGYFTVGTTPDGLLQFADDVYGVDTRQASMLADRLTSMKKSALAAGRGADDTSTPAVTRRKTAVP